MYLPVTGVKQLAPLQSFWKSDTASEHLGDAEFRPQSVTIGAQEQLVAKPP